MRHFRPLPTQTVCARCANLFVYFRTTKPRLYCTPCIPLEKQDANRFFNRWASIKRVENRRNAEAAHA